MKYAIIIVDMVNDFVTGKLGCKRALDIIKPNQKLILIARKKHIPIIYANDSHLKGIDHELKLWGDHAISNTYGAKVIDALKPTNNDYIINKRRYSAFFQTDLHILLKELGVNTLIITGLHTHMCCRHTAADGYQWGYQIVIPKDAINAFTIEDHENGLNYLKTTYGATITTVDQLIKKLLG